jgi:hypothetical protein
MTRHLSQTLVQAFGLALLTLAAGCGEETPAKPKIEGRDILGKKTQDVRNLKPELAQGGQTTDNKIHATDYITLMADSYRTTVGNLGIMAVKHSIDLFEAEHGEKPKTYEEFMEEIIKKGKPDGLWLPMLPYYQEYGYDPDKKELVVIEYPAKKKAMEEQTDREQGRK